MNQFDLPIIKPIFIMKNILCN